MLSRSLEHDQHLDQQADAGRQDDVVGSDDAHHVIEPVSPTPPGRPGQRLDIVGPVCESGDFLARDRELAIEEGELLAIHSAGAYAFAMASNYNSRCRAAEVMVDGQHVHLVRRRESLYDLLQGEAVVV